MLNRRRFLQTVSVGFLAAPVGVEAQPARKVPRVGVLIQTAPPPAPDPLLAAFRQGLRELGYFEGQSVLLEVRWNEATADRRAALVSEILRVPVDVIVVPTTGATLDAKRMTNTIPIVAAGAGALVESGAVASLARPGGNVTGLSGVQTELSAKRLELLKEALPNITRVAALMSPYRGVGVEAIGEGLLKATEAAARAVGVHLQVLRIEQPEDLEGAFQAASRDRAGAMIILPNPFFSVHAARVAALTLKYRLPTIGTERAVVEAGGFMRYGQNAPDVWRRAATYVDKILKGAKPADLPIEQPTKFELVINLKTAKALGLRISSSLLQRADQIIE
jgi:putative tryptophan/tyrosine transport system substrate-binding protein